jgi:hypothetical protein
MELVLSTICRKAALIAGADVPKTDPGFFEPSEKVSH